MTEILTPEILNTVLILGGILGAIFIAVKSPIFQTSMIKKSKKLQNDYIGELEDELDYYKKQLRSKQLKENLKDRGPQLKEGEFNEIVPELIKHIGPFLPKKLQPLFADKEISGAIIDKVLENPDQYKDIIKGFISKATNKKQNTNVEAL